MGWMYQWIIFPRGELWKVIVWLEFTSRLTLRDTVEMHTVRTCQSYNQHYLETVLSVP